MNPTDAKLACVHDYVAAFTAGDAAAAANLFADDATLEDPVGSEPRHGSAAIAAFYESAMEMGARLTLTGPIRVAGDAAAFSFTVSVATPQGGMEIDVIDVFRFNAAGRIACMQAFWGPQNMRVP